MKTKIIYYPLLILLVVTLACKEEGQEPVLPSMKLEAKEPLHLSDGAIKLSAKIIDFDPELVTEYGFYFNGASMQSTDISNDGEFELVVDDLERLTSYNYYPYFQLKDSQTRKRHTPLIVNTGFPDIESYSDTIVTDYSTITISGSGFDANIFFYLVTKSSPSGKDVTLQLKTKGFTDDQMQVSIPGIGSQDRTLPPFFEGEIQPCALYVGNEDMTKMKRIGDLDYRYRFNLQSYNGPLEGTFRVVIWSGRDVPPVEEIEVYFEGTKRILLNKEERFDFTSSGIIEAYVLEYSIPFGTESGSANKITVFSPFGEEFISVKGDEIFTVD